MPIVSAWCASGLSAPSDIAAPAKRGRIADTGSTSASGSGSRRRLRMTSWSRTVAGVRASAARYSSSASACAPAAASVCIDFTVDGAYRWRSPSPRKRAKPGSWKRAARVAASAAAARRAQLALGDDVEGHAPGPRGRGREAARGDVGLQLHHLEQRAADVRGGGADAHPREHLAQARRRAR